MLPLLFISTLPTWLQVTLALVPLLGVPATLLALNASLKSIRKERETTLLEQARREEQEKAALEARLKDYTKFKEQCATEMEHVNQRFLGFSQQVERVAEKAESDSRALHEKFSTVHILSDKVSTLQLTVTNTDSKVDKLETRMDARFTTLDSKLDAILMGLADLNTLRKHH